MSRYVKFISALLGSLATWGYSVTEDNTITQGEWFGILGVLATAFAVYQFPNVTPDTGAGDPDVSEQDRPVD